METKPWYKSKTMIFNFVCIMLIGAEANFPIIEAYLSKEVYSLALFVITMANIGLRTITTTGVSR